MDSEQMICISFQTTQWVVESIFLHLRECEMHQFPVDLDNEHDKGLLQIYTICIIIITILVTSILLILM